MYKFLPIPYLAQSSTLLLIPRFYLRASIRCRFAQEDIVWGCYGLTLGNPILHMIWWNETGLASLPFLLKAPWKPPTNFLFSENFLDKPALANRCQYQARRLIDNPLKLWVRRNIAVDVVGPWPRPSGVEKDKLLDRGKHWSGCKYIQSAGLRSQISRQLTSKEGW